MNKLYIVIGSLSSLKSRNTSTNIERKPPRLHMAEWPERVDFLAQHTIQVPLHQQLASVPQHQHHLKEPKNEMEFNLRPQWRLWNFTSQKPNRSKCGLIHQSVCLATYNKCFKRGKKWHYGRMCFPRTKFEQVNTNLNHHDKNHLGNHRTQKSKRKT